MWNQLHNPKVTTMKPTISTSTCFPSLPRHSSPGKHQLQAADGKGPGTTSIKWPDQHFFKIFGRFYPVRPLYRGIRSAFAVQRGPGTTSIKWPDQNFWRCDIGSILYSSLLIYIIDETYTKIFLNLSRIFPNFSDNPCWLMPLATWGSLLRWIDELMPT